MDFTGKVVIVTGGANGIGKCLTKEFSKHGALVVVIDKDKVIDGLAVDFAFQGDIAKEETLKDFVQAVLARYGKIDYLINNAALSKKGIVSRCNYEDFLYVQKVGVVAPYMLTMMFLEHFNEQAAIVNISSSRFKMSQPDTESYTACKGGITALTHALAVSLAGKVRVNSVAPGWIDNVESNLSKEDLLQHSVGRVGKPIDVAKMVMFLCSTDSGFINGENITVDGGMSKLMIYNGDYGWEYRV